MALPFGLLRTVGHRLMVTPTCLFLTDQAALCHGLILIGLAPCMAMVLIVLGIPLPAITLN
ncbi:MAG: hypothetical protein EBZ51_05395 [Synechococcaceae bacterium WB9_2_112]|nr:hypothetical protein [Synechococcaceae bacterium WB9_2_112]